MTAYLQTLFQFGAYKRKQGRVARQVTFISLVIVAAAGAWSLHGSLEGIGGESAVRSAGPISIAVFGLLCWASYRLIQLPKFAEFLISVEQEMNKVSWPARGELWRASVVVMLTIFVLAGLLFAYDLVWQQIIEGIMDGFWGILG